MATRLTTSKLFHSDFWPLRVLAKAGMVFTLAGTAWASPAPADILASIDGKPITAEEVATAVGMPLYTLEAKAFDIKRQKLRAMITERLLAAESARRKIPVQQLLEEINRKAEPSEAEVDAFYLSKQEYFGTDDKVAARSYARSLLLAQRRGEAHAALLKELAEKAKVAEYLKAPAAPSLENSLQGGIARGGDGATVTLVEFTDFHCPFCKMAATTRSELQEKYGDKLRYVHRDYPIARLHPQAPRAHLAARCADEQGKFWPFHDKIFAGPSDSGKEQLTTYAREAGLNLDAFEQCLGSNKYQTALQKDMEDGTRLGVTGTPTFFINGRMLTGAQPLTAFVELIEEELARKGPKASQPPVAQTGQLAPKPAASPARP